MPDFSADCRSISLGPDTGFLSCAGAFFFNPLQSNNNDQAFDNLGGCVARFGDKRKLLLIGHGNVGLIATGGGQCPSMSGQTITARNRADWIYQLRRTIFTHTTTLALCSCDTGAGDAGADLLYQLATDADCIVWASTYLVWCDGRGGPVYLDRAARWQVAYPGLRPDPIPGHSLVMQDEVSHLRMFVDQQPVDIPIEAVQEVTLQSGCGHNRSGPQILTDGPMRDIIRQIEFRRPMLKDAQPAAIITGSLTVIFDHNGQSIAQNFTIYNDYLLQSESDNGIYYFASSNFANLIR